jgi:hypothetical protein
MALEQQVWTCGLAVVQAVGFRLQVRAFLELCRVLLERKRVGGLEKGVCAGLEAGTVGRLGEMHTVELQGALRVLRAYDYTPELAWVGAYALKSRGALEGLKAGQLEEMVRGLGELGVYVPGGWIAAVVRELGTRARGFADLMEVEMAAAWALEGGPHLASRGRAGEQLGEWEGTLTSRERDIGEQRNSGSDGMHIRRSMLHSECMREWQQAIRAVGQLLVVGAELVPKASSSAHVIFDQVLTDNEKWALERSMPLALRMVGADGVRVVRL